MLVKAMTAAVMGLCMSMSPALAWDEQRALGFILEHHPVLQSQREAHAAERMLNPVSYTHLLNHKECKEALRILL